MKNLLPILALLLLVGCTSELDRCIEANYEKPSYDSSTGFNHLENTNQIRLTCRGEGVGQYTGKLEGENAEQCIERRLNYYDDQRKNLAIKNAKKICNSQGIY